MRNYARAIEHMGLQHRFVSDEQVEKGELGRAGYRVLILPRTIALSARAAEAIRDFVRQGGAVIADGEPGIFDEHGRRLARPALAEIFPSPMSPSATQFGFGKGHAIYLPAPRDQGSAERLSDIFAAAGIEPLVSVMRSDGRPAADVETYVFENGRRRSSRCCAISTHRPRRPNLRPDRQEAIDLKLPHPYEVYDVRSRRALGLTSRLTLALGPVEPIVLALSEQPLPGLSISGPPSVHVGENADFRISPNGNSSAARDIIHIEIADPDGKVVPHYSANRLAQAGTIASYWLPLALNDKAGSWTIRVRDVLTGGVPRPPSCRSSREVKRCSPDVLANGGGAKPDRLLMPKLTFLCRC